MDKTKVVDRETWLRERTALLAKEKEFTRLRDELTAQRQAMPLVEITKPYQFSNGTETADLLQLFNSKSQLIIYHFMFGVDWETGCKSCSYWADNFNGIDAHLAQRDIAFHVVSSAAIEKLLAFKTRMGWNFSWFSSLGSTFGEDFGVSFSAEHKSKKQIHYNYRQQNWYMDELPGISVLVKDEADRIYHSYSTYSRGLDMLNGAYNFIDLTPKGRHEEGRGMHWVRLHDEYE